MTADLNYEQHVNDLSRFLSGCQGELDESEAYLESRYRLRTLGLGAPPEMRYLRVDVGWPSLYLNALEERLDVEGFRISGSSDKVDQLWDWWQANGLDEESSMGHMDALTFGRSYITIAAPDPANGDDPGIPIIQLESPMSMYAEIDPRTRQVTRALRLFKSTEGYALEGRHRDELSGIPNRATLLLPNKTIYLSTEGGASNWQLDGDPVVHNLGVVPVVPLTNRGKLSDRYGRSEITPEIRTLTDAAARIVMNLQAAAELMAVPMRVFFGVNKEELVGDGGSADINNAYYARIMALENEAAKAYEFSAAELRNFTDALGELAKEMAAYTGLPPQYLSFSSDNPASAEAIQSSESRLVKKCERKARMFGGSWEQAMRIAMKIMGDDVPSDYTRLETVWRDPSTPTYAAKADAATKLYAGGLGVIPKERARIDMGYSIVEREEMQDWDKEEMQGLLGAYATGPGSVVPAPISAPAAPAAPSPAAAPAKPAPAK